MAELLSLGKHCAVEYCKQLDFLPFTCDACSRVFCLKHKSPDSHGCSQVNFNRVYPTQTDSTSFRCSVEGCENRELMPLVCSICGARVCLSHRHSLDHACLNQIQEKPSKTAEHVKQLLALHSKSSPTSGLNSDDDSTERLLKPSKPPSAAQTKSRGPKAEKMAAKVALMKLKMNAIGDKGIPVMDRIYFQVLLPLGTKKERTKEMFFSKNWAIGKVIDKVALCCGLRNENNKTTGKWLHLFSASSGQRFPTETTLAELLENNNLSIHNGSSIIAEYSDKDCICLEDVDIYTS